jgi:hypothetical protein
MTLEDPKTGISGSCFEDFGRDKNSKIDVQQQTWISKCVDSADHWKVN